MIPYAVPLLRRQPKCCSGWASLTQRSSLLPAHGSSPLWESCSSTSRYTALLKVRLFTVAPCCCTLVLENKIYSHFSFFFFHCPGHRAGQGGCEKVPCCAEPTPEHPYLPCGREGHPCRHHRGLLHALALQTGLSQTAAPCGTLEPNGNTSSL